MMETRGRRSARPGHPKQEGSMTLHRLKASLTVMVGAALTVILSGCATIMQGTTQELSVSSSPTGAQVTVNGQAKGTTPAVLDLKRKDNHVVRVTMDGYQPFEVALSRSTSGWVWGNLVFGGIPGLAVDAITGGLYKLSPEQISAALSKEDVVTELDEDRLVILVALRPDPAWERVGQIERE